MADPQLRLALLCVRNPNYISATWKGPHDPVYGYLWITQRITGHKRLDRGGFRFLAVRRGPRFTGNGRCLSTSDAAVLLEPPACHRYSILDRLLRYSPNVAIP